MNAKDQRRKTTKVKKITSITTSIATATSTTTAIHLNLFVRFAVQTESGGEREREGKSNEFSFLYCPHS